jgi:hypothetical protein
MLTTKKDVEKLIIVITRTEKEKESLLNTEKRQTTKLKQLNLGVSKNSSLIGYREERGLPLKESASSFCHAKAFVS